MKQILIVDTEGIGSLKEDESHDTKIFLLSLMISSYFIYNSLGCINEKSI